MTETELLPPKNVGQGEGKHREAAQNGRWERGQEELKNKGKGRFYCFIRTPSV